MGSLIVAISGSGGGNRGPQGIYRQFEKLEGPGIRVVAVDTIPDDVPRNSEKVTQLILSQKQLPQSVYLVGYSMGGAVAAIAAYELSQKHEGLVKGVVLLSSQTDGLRALFELNIPVLFYHGQKDSIFPLWEMESIYARLPGQKKMVQAVGLEHSLAPNGLKSSRHTHQLAQDVVKEISDFFQLSIQIEEKAMSKKGYEHLGRITSFFSYFNFAKTTR